jgi:hypothetical protein
VCFAVLSIIVKKDVTPYLLEFLKRLSNIGKAQYFGARESLIT